MAIEIITKDDLEQFRLKLLTDIQELLGKRPEASKKWLKSYQVKNMLRISPNTLQKLRSDGTIRFNKIGGILYYNYEDIVRLVEGSLKTRK